MKKILANLGKALLTIGMLLYLGKHSLNFFQFTFKGEDGIYALLGLLTTSAGVLIWLTAFLWLASSTLQKTVALIMVVISLLGEFGVAAFDMWMNASGLTAGGVKFSDVEIKNMTLVVAGLALLHGLALVVDVAGDAIAEVWNEAKEKRIKPGRDDDRVTVQGVTTPARKLPAPVDQDGLLTELFKRWNPVVRGEEKQYEQVAQVFDPELGRGDWIHDQARNFPPAQKNDDKPAVGKADKLSPEDERTSPSWSEIRRIDDLQAQAARDGIKLDENDPRLQVHFWGIPAKEEVKPKGEDASFPLRDAPG